VVGVVIFGRELWIVLVVVVLWVCVLVVVKVERDGRERLGIRRTFSSGSVKHGEGQS